MLTSIVPEKSYLYPSNSQKTVFFTKASNDLAQKLVSLASDDGTQPTRGSQRQGREFADQPVLLNSSSIGAADEPLK